MPHATSRPSKLVISIIVFAIVVVLQLALLLFLEGKEKKEQRKLIGNSLGFYHTKTIKIG